jgi:hypothetical protein
MILPLLELTPEFAKTSTRMMKTCPNRVLRNTEKLGDLLALHLLKFKEYKHLALFVWKLLHHRLDPSLRFAPSEQHLGLRRLTARSPIRASKSLLKGAATRKGSTMVPYNIHSDTTEPALEIGTGLKIIPAAMRGEKNLLNNIFNVSPGTREPSDDPRHQTRMGVKKHTDIDRLRLH